LRENKEDLPIKDRGHRLERIDPADFHSDYYPKNELFEMVGGYYAGHQPPTEDNFDSDHTELGSISQNSVSAGIVSKQINIHIPTYICRMYVIMHEILSKN
jgi:hypothetical protein